MLLPPTLRTVLPHHRSNDPPPTTLIQLCSFDPGWVSNGQYPLLHRQHYRLTRLIIPSPTPGPILIADSIFSACAAAQMSSEGLGEGLSVGSYSEDTTTVPGLHILQWAR